MKKSLDNSEKKLIRPTPGDISLVLNNDETEMDAATIKIRWFFSKAVSAKKPTYLVFFEQNESQRKNDEDGTFGTFGHRYYCEVKKTVKFLQLFSHGTHRLAVIALAGPNAKKTAKKLTQKERYGVYDKSITFSEIEENTYINNEKQKKNEFSDAFVAATTTEFSIPEGLFAPPPPAWKKKWVNLFFKHNAIDECQFHKRAWSFAYHIQIPLVIVWLVLRYLIFSGTYCLYIIITSFYSWFFGFQTKNIFWMFHKAIQAEDLYPYNSDWACDNKSYLAVIRCNKYKMKYPKRGGVYSRPSVRRKATPVGITGWTLLITLIWGVIYGSIRYITKKIDSNVFWEELKELLEVLQWIGYIIFAVIAIVLIIKILSAIYNSKFIATRRAKSKERKEVKAKAYQVWLEKYFSFKNRPTKVDLDILPKPQKKTERFVQKFYISKWAIKMKVCKPFSE